MKNTYLFFMFLFTINSQSFCQSKNNNNQYLIFSIGQGFDYGFISVKKNPTLGFGYEKDLSKYFSVGIKIWYYYRTFKDSDLLSDGFGRPVVDILIQGAYGPFVSKEEIDKISDVGIKYLDPGNTIKELSIPVIFTISFYPLKFHNSRLGLVGGLGAGYNSYNWWRDAFPLKKIILNDGTEYTELYLTQNTEFRNIMFQDYLSITYSYEMKKMILGCNFSDYAQFIGGYNHNLEISLFAKLKI